MEYHVAAFTEKTGAKFGQKSINSFKDESMGVPSIRYFMTLYTLSSISVHFF
jgi:hypothetical protein